MLPQKSGLVGERLVDHRWVVDLEVIGVVVPGLAAGRPPGRQLDVLGVDEVLSVAHAHQQWHGDVAGVPER